MEFFTDSGVNILNYPMISIDSVELNSEIIAQFDKLNEFDWVVFTSKNGVKSFLQLWKQHKNGIPDFTNIKIAAIGQATANILSDYGYKTAFINPGTTSNEFIHAIDKHEIIKNIDNVLLVLGNLAPDTLKQKLKEITPKVQRINVYQTSYLKQINPDFKKTIEAHSDALLVFTSPSAFDNFINHCEVCIQDKLKLQIASIGKTTSHFIKLKGFTIAVESSKSTFEDLAEKIIEYLKK
jgi:uroporphyrinogen-III synthase